MRRLHHFATAFAVVLFATVLGLAGGAHVSAHNTLEGTNPPDGAVLTESPASITFDFSASVPLETATVQVTDPTGARTEAALSHGASDDQLVATLPSLPAGDVGIRWRLVGPDGHPLTGRVGVTIAAAATTTMPTTTAAPPTSAPAGASPAAPTPTTTAPAANAGPQASSDDADALSVPDPVRWLLRYSSYLAVMIVVGIVLTDRFVWAGVARLPLPLRAVRVSLVAIAVLAAAQLLVLASDIAGTAPWAALGSLDASFSTGAGLALGVRILLAAALWWLLFHTPDVDDTVRDPAVVLTALATLATWAWAGHSATQRWADVGMPIDVAHHAAAALWIAGLMTVGILAARQLPASRLATVVERLSTTASIAVAIIVLTGVVQSLRLVGTPGDLFDATHGKLLAAKLTVVAAMLGVAALNRRHVRSGSLRSGGAATAGPDVDRLRRSILIELVLGLVAIGITSAMVVSPPATSVTPGEASAPTRDNYSV